MAHRSTTAVRAAVLAACVVASAAVPGLAQMTAPTKTLTASQKVAPSILVKRIDLNCSTTKSFTSTIKPKHVVLKASTWALASDADVAVAAKTHAALAIVDVWKQNGKYVWFHGHTFTASGAQRASQMCFRPDGTLARVRQATTVPSLDAATARAAYYNTDGSVISKVGVVEMNDPTIAKTITAEPFFSTLP